MLGQLANGLADEAKKAKEKGDAGAFSSLASKAQSALTALAKHSAPKDEEHEGQYVTNDAIAKYAEAARTKILDRVERAAREASP